MHKNVAQKQKVHSNQQIIGIIDILKMSAVRGVPKLGVWGAEAVGNSLACRTVCPETVVCKKIH